MLFTLSFFMFKNKIAHSSSKNFLATMQMKEANGYAKILIALNMLRNKLLAEGRYTDAVDDILIKVVSAPIKKFKIRITEV